MNFVQWFFMCIVALCSYIGVRAGGHGGHDHVKFIIHYPVKTIKHTHTIYKTIYHKEDDGGHSLGHSHGGVPFSHGWH